MIKWKILGFLLVFFFGQNVQATLSAIVDRADNEVFVLTDSEDSQPVCSGDNCPTAYAEEFPEEVESLNWLVNLQQIEGLLQVVESVAQSDIYYYVAESGDTLYVIASYFGCSVGDLISLSERAYTNFDPANLSAGQKVPLCTDIENIELFLETVDVITLID